MISQVSRVVNFISFHKMISVCVVSQAVTQLSESAPAGSVVNKKSDNSISSEKGGKDKKVDREQTAHLADKLYREIIGK